MIALQLRLSELEFNDPILMRWRSRLRQLGDKTQRLIQEYRKYQRKRLTAEAQVAWRSTWLNDREDSTRASMAQNERNANEMKSEGETNS